MSSANGNGGTPPPPAPIGASDEAWAEAWADFKAEKAERLDRAGGERRPPRRDRCRLRVLDTGHMVSTEPKAIPQLVEGIVGRGSLAMLSGREKEGKSLVCQAVAATVASGGGSVAGIRCAPGRALLVDAENSEPVIHRRLRALRLDERHAGNLVVVEARGFDLRRDLADLDAIITERGVDLVVLDSWRSLWGGKENDSDDVAACLDPVRHLAHERDVGIVLIHHKSRRGDYRGSTAAGASVENLVQLGRDPEDPDRRRRCLRNTGCRYAEEAPDRWLVVEGDRDLGLLLVDAAPAFRAAHEQPRAAPRIRDELAPQVLAHLGDEPQRLAEVCRAIGRDAKDATVRRVLQALEEQGEATRRDGHWLRCQVSTPKGGADTLTPDTLGEQHASTGDRA